MKKFLASISLLFSLAIAYTPSKLVMNKAKALYQLAYSYGVSVASFDRCAKMVKEMRLEIEGMNKKMNLGYSTDDIQFLSYVFFRACLEGSIDAIKDVVQYSESKEFENFTKYYKQIANTTKVSN